MDGTEPRVGTGECSFPTRPAAGESALLCASGMDHRGDEGCIHLSFPSDPQNVYYLGVTLDEAADEQKDRWHRYVGDLPAKMAIVSADEQFRGAAAAGGGSPPVSVEDVSVTSISDPSDLTGLGIKMNQCLSGWQDAPVDVVVCFRSLTTLLQYASLQRSFRFLHVLTRRIQSFGARAHFHIDPQAHSRKEMATLRNLFDRVYRLNPDGQWFEV